MKKTIYLLSIILLSCIHAYPFTQTVSVANFSFSPSSFTIAVGDTVKWMLSSGSHTTTSLTIPAGATAWNTPINSLSTTFIYVPTVPGTYNYQCNIHLSMQASFTVTGCPPVSGQVSASGPTAVCKPASVTLNCFATAGAAFQWQKNGVNITTNGNGPSYTATASGNYKVKVSNNCGSTFTTNTVAVTITTLPAAVIANGDTVFKCTVDSVTLNATTTGTVTYQWLKSNLPISGATGPTYKTKAAGTYKVVVTKSPSGCSKTSKVCRIINNCRLADASIAAGFDMQLYPNPASEQIVLNFEAPYQVATVQVVNITGQTVMQQQLQSADGYFEQQLNISLLPAGVYTLTVKTESDAVHQLFVKQ